MKKLRQHRFALAALMLGSVVSWSTFGFADTIYKTNSGSNTFLDLFRSTTGAPTAFAMSYAEGATITAADILAFNNLINSSPTFRVSSTQNAVLDVNGLQVGDIAGTVTISNGTATNSTTGEVTGLLQTIRIGSGGIDLSAATGNLTFQSDILGNTPVGSLTVATTAPQTWTIRNTRSLSFTNTPVSLGNDVTIGFVGGNGGGTAGVVALNGNISGTGNMNITGMNGGSGGTVTMSGDNGAGVGWSGAATVAGGARLNLDYATIGATQNKLADAKTLTITRGQVNLQGANTGTEVVSDVSLGQGLNLITKSGSTAVVLRANSISHSTGAGLDVGNIGTSAASSFLSTDNLNTNLILGSWAVAIDTTTPGINWLKNATNGIDGKVIAASGADYTTQNVMDSWTTPTQNILMTAIGAASTTGSKTISSLKIQRTTSGTVNVDVGSTLGDNTLTINDGANGGGIIRNQTGATNITNIGGTTIGSNFLTAGGVDDSIDDTLYLWNVQNTMTVNSFIADNNTGAGSDKLHLFSGGAGIVRLTADNTYTGGTTIAAGTLTLGAGAADANGDNANAGTAGIANFGSLIIDKSTGSTTLLNNDISGTGSLTLNRGTLFLMGANTYSGDTIVQASSTVSPGTAASLSPDSVVVLNAASATLDLTTLSSTVAALRGSQATAAVLIDGGTLTLTGSEKARPGSPNNTLASTPQIYQGGISGTGGIIKDGAYTQQFTGSGVAAYAGTTVVNAGTLLTTKVLSQTSGVTLNGSGTFVSNIANVVGNTAPVDLAGSSSLWTIGNTFNQSVGALKGTTGGRVSAGSGVTLTVGNTTGAAATFGGVITGEANLVFAGANPWVLTGGNSYTGTTTINQGILQIGAVNLVEVIPDRTAVTLANVAGAALDLNGNLETIGSLGGGGALGGNVTLGTTGRLTTGGNNGTTAYAGVISGGTAGTDSLVKVGNGTLTLSNTNTFFGNVLIRGSGGGLTLTGGTALTDTVAVRNAGLGTTLTLTSSETLGAVTGARNTVLALGSNTLTASYANGTAVTTGTGTADTNNGFRVVKDISTRGLTPGMLIVGSLGLTNGSSYVVQILDGNNVLINNLPGATFTDIPSVTITPTSVLSSNVTGTGGFTKNGTGDLFLTGNNTYSGATTINTGNVWIGGGIWDNTKFSFQDVLSDSSPVVFASTGVQNLNFALNATNLAPFERVASIAGGAGNVDSSNVTTINLSGLTTVFGTGSATASLGALAMGRDDTSTAYTGQIFGGAGTFLIKEGSGTFTWNNPTSDGNTFDGTLLLDKGGFTTGGAGGLDANNTLFLQNNTTTFTSAVTDTFGILQGGGKGASRLFPNNTVGALTANYLTGADATLAINNGVVLTTNTATSSIFGGVISGLGGFTQSGTSTLDLRGANTYTGLTTVTAGTLRLGAYGAAAGIGSPGTGGFGSLDSGTSLQITTAGMLDLNSSAQTVTRIAGNGTGTIQLLNGSLSLTAQTTLSTANVFTGNIGSVINIAAPAAATLTLTGNSNAFAGTINVGANVAITSSTMGDTARINLNGTGTQLTVTAAETIGSLAGTGNVALAAALTLSEARSGTASATGYSGVISGTGGSLVLGNNVTFTGIGGLTLSKTQTYTGATVLSSNSLLNLDFNASGATDILPNSALTLNGASVRLYNSTGVSSIVDAVSVTNLNAGASVIQSFAAFNAESPSNQTLGKGALRLGTITRGTANGGTLLVGPDSASNNFSGRMAAYAVFNGTDWAFGNGLTAAITALAPGSYTANIFAAGNNTDVTANVAGGATATIRFNTPGAFTVTNAGAAAVSTGGILVTPNVGANTSTITGAGALSSGASAELFIQQFNPLGDLVLTNVGGTNTVITKAGGGRAIITNNMSGGGATFVNAGILQLGTGAGGSAAGMVGSGGIRTDGILAINRSNAQSFGAVISGNGGISQIGTGTTTLSGTNTYSGRTVISAGTLVITNVAALGAGAAFQNLGANLTSIRSGATLDINIAGSITEALNLDGGTVNIRSASATTLASAALAGTTVPITFSNGSTISLGAGAAVTHVLSAPLIGIPGSNLNVTGVASGSTLALTSPFNQLNGTLTIGANANVSVGNNTTGTLGGRGNVIDNGTLIFNSNDGQLVIGNAISGSGNLTQARNTVYLTANNTYSGTTTVGSTAAAATLRIGNDTYSGSLGAGAVTVQSSTGLLTASAASQLRFHVNGDYTVANTVTLLPNASTDATPVARNADFVKEGLGTMDFSGTMIGGAHVAAPGTQRSLITVNAGGALKITGTINDAVGTEVNIANNSIVIVGGSSSNVLDGVLSGNSVWVFNTTGTTTLNGVNTFNTGNTYIQRGTVVLNNATDAIQNDNDTHLMRGATLTSNFNETLGLLYTQRGSTVNIGAGTTLTIDDPAAQYMGGTFAGATGNLTLAGGNYAAIYGTNTFGGNLLLNNATVQSPSLTNAIGSAAVITLGSAANAGNLEYIGSGETFAKNIILDGTATKRITASGNGGLTLSGNLTANANSTLSLSGQTGGIIASTAIANTISGSITEGTGVLSLLMAATANDDRFGVTGRWKLTNAANDFSGAVTVNVGILELNGDLKTGVETTSVLGDLSATRTITLGTNNFDGRRYDIFGGGDNLGAVGTTGSMGTLIFNDPNAGTATLGSNITFTQAFSSTTAPGRGKLVNDGVKVINIAGNLTSGASGARAWSLDGTNTGINTISGAISDTSGGETVSIIKEGSGTWRLSGANSFEGSVTVTRGLLQISGGTSVRDTATVAVSDSGSDGLSTINHATFQVMSSETIGELTGNIGATTIIDPGATLTLAGASGTYSGIITGDGSLSKTITGTTNATLTLSNRNTYTGVTTIGIGSGAAAGISVWHMGNGGQPSGIGASGSAAANLVFNNGASTAGGLTWSGFGDQTTDRLFTMGTGVGAASIIASGTVIGTTAPKLTFSSTGLIAFLATDQTGTTQLGGSTISDNQFSPRITNNGTGAISLSKTGAGMWLVTNPLNSYTGGTVINAGTLAINATSAPGTGALGTGVVTIRGGAGVGLEIRGGGAGITVANNIDYSPLAAATTDGGIHVTGTGTTTASGTLSFNSTNGTSPHVSAFRISVDTGATLDFTNTTAALTGAGIGTSNIIKFGGGILTLSGVNNYSAGNMIVSGGTLKLNYAASDTTKLLDTGSLSLGWTGSGVLTGLGADDNVAGQTNIAGLSGAQLELAGGTHTEIVSATTLAIGSNSVTRSSGNATLRMNTITRNTGATVDFGTASIATADNSNTNGILGGYATVGKANWAVTIASNPGDTAITALAAAGYNNGLATDTYGAGFNTDVINFTSPAADDVTNTLRFNQAGGGTLALPGILNLQSGGVLVTPTSGNVIISGGAIQNNATTGGLEAAIIHQHSTNSLQINSVIQNNTGAQGITKSGAGKVFLNAVNTQTGTINLNEGEIQVGGTIAVPGTPTSATLGGGNNALNISQGTTLTFNSNNGTDFDFGLIQGGGTIQTTSANTQALLINDGNSNYTGEIIVGGSTLLRVAGNNAALGDIRGRTLLNSGAVMQIEDSRALGELITMSQGTTIRTLAAATGASISGMLTLNNSTTGGAVFDLAAGSALTLSGIIQTSNGFTKNGNGTLTLSGNQFTNVVDGFTAVNASPSLVGKIQFNAGLLNLGNARGLGATGVGNETIIASGATLDLRGQSLNFGDDPNSTREIISIAGTGVNGLGALRNTTGTAQISNLTLTGNATVTGGGFVNSSILSLSTYDTTANNGSVLEGNFTRNQPVINGGGFDLTIVGSRGANDGFILQDPSFSSALNKIVLREGGLRIDNAIGPVSTLANGLPSTFTGISSANVTNGIEIGYGGATLAEHLTPSLGLAPNVGARLNLQNNWDIHHTVGITMNGVLAASNNGVNYIDTAASTIPSSRTYLDGTMTLSGNASRNVIHVDSATSTTTVAEQGNLTGSIQSKLIVGGEITGSGGFTKTGYRELRLTNDNNFSGDLNVLRFGTTSVPWQTNTVQVNGVNYQTYGNAEGWAEWGLTVSGLNGALSGTGNINLERRGMITLDNTTILDLTSATLGGNNDNRINDAASILFNHGWLRINGGTVNNSESLATAFGAKVQLQSGTNILDLYPTDGANTNMTLTIGEISRTPGAVLRIQNLDSTSTFSTAAGANSVRVKLDTIGTLTEVGAALGVTDKKVVTGILGGTIPLSLDEDFRLLGFNNANVADPLNQERNLQFLTGSHFMTYDGGYLRPLDDSEYYVPSDGLINTTNGAAGQNLNLNDVYTIMSGSTSINALRFGPLSDNNGSGGAFQAGSTLTSLTDHHALQLMVDGTLTINSGMISSAYFTVGNTSNASTLILGGNLDFGTREAIINNQNGYYNMTAGVVSGGELFIRSNISGSGGLTKTGFQQVRLEGQNSYSGLTTINDGVILVTSGRTGLGVGGAGNGIVIQGNGGLNTGFGVQVGTAAAPEDLLIKALQGDQQILRNDNDLTNWFGDVIIDNVDAAGQVLFTPRIRTDNNATTIINGDIYGGPTAVTNDIIAIDSRIVQFDAAGNNTFIFRGVFGDKSDGLGNAIPISSGPISTLPTGSVLPAGFALPAGTVVTNENEVLRVTLAGTIQTNFFFDEQYNAAGRLTNAGGIMLINYDPAAPGNDGTGFWTDTAISKIPLADSITTTFTTNQSTNQKGFAFTGTGGLFLMRDGQSFNMAAWASSGNATKTIGGLNESGTVTFGNGTGVLSIADLEVQLYAASGGTVLFNQRLTGSPGTAPENLGVLKMGRGTVILQNDNQVTASDTNLELGGGTLVLDHKGGANIGRVGTGVATFNGGVLLAQPHQSNPSTVSLATGNAANVLARFFLGGTEFIAETENGRNMTINIGNANANLSGTTVRPNLERVLGGTANFVEYQKDGSGVGQITLEFNSATTAATKNGIISWATYGTAPRTALDFAMVDSATSPVANDVAAFGRAADEYVNNVAAWGDGFDVSEIGGAGFTGTLAGSRTLSTVRFDTSADSLVNLGSGQTLNLTGTGAAGGILVSSNVGAANKTITGGTLTATTTQTAITTNANSTLTGLASTANLAVGMPVSGSGIPAGTVITSIASGSSVTLSANATAGATSTLSFGNELVIHQYGTGDLNVNSSIGTPLRYVNGVTTNASATVTVASTTGLTAGMGITGPNIPAGATILAVVNGTTLTLSTNATGAGTGLSFTAGLVRNAGVTSSGSASVSMASTAGLAASQPFSGPNIPAGTTILTVDSPTTVTLSAPATAGGSGLSFVAGSSLTSGVTLDTSKIVSVASTTGLAPGMTIVGPNIPAGTTITAINSPTSLTLSAPASNASTGVAFTVVGSSVTGGQTVDGSKTVTVSSTVGLTAGMAFTGPSIPAGTVIATVVNATTLTLSAPATAGGSGLAFIAGSGNLVNGVTTSGNATVTMASTAGLAVGMAFAGPNIPAGATITNVNVNGTTLTLSANSTGSGTGLAFIAGTSNLTAGVTTSGSATVTMTSTAGLAPGLAFSGPNIPAGTTILSVVNGTTLTLSANATAAGTSLAFIAGSTGTTAGVTVDTSKTLTVASTAGLAAGMPIVGPNIPAGTFITEVVNATTLKLSAAATSAGTGLSFTAGGILAGGMTTSGSATVTMASTAGLVPGMTLIGPNIPAGATISSVVDATTITISNNATVTGSAFYTVGSIVGLTITGPSSTGVDTIGTTGAVVLGPEPNLFNGRVVVGGSVLSFSNPDSLGINPAAVVTNQITLNGGTLRYTETGMADLGNRGVRIEGNGGVMDVVDPNGELRIAGDLNSLRTFQGDLVKVGAGTLTLGATNNANFGGMIDVREGTLRLNSSGTGAAGATTILGTNASIADSTIFRTGTNFAIQMSNGDNTGDWQTEEWLTFEGNNYITIGTPNTNLNAGAGFDNPSARAAVNLYGVNTINGTVTFDTVGTQILRLNNGSGYTTGNGDIIKDGQGTMEFRGNIPDWTGNLIIKQGVVYAANQADVFGTGYLTGKTITLGGIDPLGNGDRQGLAEIRLSDQDQIQNHYIEINHDINVVYNPTQTKRIGVETVANGTLIEFNGDITLNDNLSIHINDAAEVGGSQNYVNFNGQFKDGAVTSGNITFSSDEADGTASNATNGRTVNYAVLNANNSLWTGDATIGANTAYDHDQTMVVRFGNAQALTAANDVTMNFNSILQVGGGPRTIGSLITQGGNGPFFGDAGTMSASTNGSSEIIENAASTIGTLTINQTTPAAVEVAWDAKFRDGTLNSQFFAPGANTSQPSAALNIVKSGTGWATLTLDNDYTGTTTVSEGILQVGRGGVGDSGAPNAAGLTVNSAASLAGTGIVQGPGVVQNGASLNPGDLAGALMGTITFNGNATLQTNSTTTLQTQRATYNNAGYVGGTDYAGWISNVPFDVYSNALRDPVLTSQHDMVNVLGSLTWNAGTKIVLANNGYTPNVGDVFDLFDWFSVVGTINVGSQIRTGAETGTDLDLFELGGNYRWDTSLFNSNGILVVTLPSLIPEPSRMILLMFGLLGVFFRRRRQYRKS